MPAAAVKGISQGSGHSGYPPHLIIDGEPAIFINGSSAVAVGDALNPHAKPDSPPHGGSTAAGSSTVFLNGSPMVRNGDPISCGSVVIGGVEGVQVGG